MENYDKRKSTVNSGRSRAAAYMSTFASAAGTSELEHMVGNGESRHCCHLLIQVLVYWFFYIAYGVARLTPEVVVITPPGVESTVSSSHIQFCNLSRISHQSQISIDCSQANVW